MSQGTKTMKVHLNEDGRYVEGVLTIFSQRKLMEIVTKDKQRIIFENEVSTVTELRRENSVFPGTKMTLSSGEQILMLGRYDSGRISKLLIEYFS